MRKMKDSGIEWIGEIPEDWECFYLSQIFSQVKNKNIGILETNLLSLSYGKIIRKNIETTFGLLPENFEGYNIIERDNIVLRLTDLQNDHKSLRVGLVTEKGIITSAYLTLKNKTNMSSNYFYYLLHSFDIAKGFYGMGAGVRQGLNWNEIRSLRIISPKNVPEQQRIADFLDDKVSQIDSVISKTRETIEEYKKLKQSIITEVVTGKVKIENEKACGKYDTYKDSGVEWIGEIPIEWEVKPIKALFSFGKGLPITKDNLTETGLSVISYGQIHSKNNIGTEIRNELIRYVDKIYYETNPQSLVHKGDFIFADTSEDLTGCGNFVYVNREEDLFAGYHTIILFSKEKNDNKYLAYLFQTDCWRRQIRCCCSGVKLFSISRRILGSTNLILPSILEQHQIADFLDKKCSEIDNLITKKEQLVVELESYKKSLIYEVVTGKRSV